MRDIKTPVKISEIREIARPTVGNVLGVPNHAIK
jgi:hypothetical protein